MPIINCPDCKNEMSDAAPACPKCGRPNDKTPSPAPPKRSVGFILGTGILLFPIIFSWLTLRKGHSVLSRAVSFIWLVICLAFVIGDTNKAVSSSDTSSSSSSVSAVTASSALSNSSTPSKPEESVIEIDIRQILAAYKNNEVAADNKYKGNLIQTTGIVDDIKKDIMDNLYVTLGTGKDFEIPQVQAFFDDSMNAELGNLNKGQGLTVVCRVKGLMMNVLAEKCVIK